jgi:ferredoxin-NADP reductase
MPTAAVIRRSPDRDAAAVAVGAAIRPRSHIRRSDVSRTHDETDLRLEVAGRETVADGVVALNLCDPSGAHLPAWEPGAHIDLKLGPDVVRQYSLCGDPADGTVWRVGILRVPGGRGGSEYVHAQMREGSTVDARGPRNRFSLEPSPRYVFIAGGIGITPILPMVAAATATDAEWELHYGGRALSSMAFHGYLSESYGARVTLYPQDEKGLLDLDAILGTPRRDTLVYCCGPEPLLEAAEARCASWPAGSLHLERFAPRERGRPLRPQTFEVELAQSGLTVTVPQDASILDVLERAGVPVLASCREGTCGTCETPVLAGEIDHRDNLLTSEERAANTTMFVCVSRGASPRLVLDL